MLQQGVGYSYSNSSLGSSLTIDIPARPKETLPLFIYEDTDSNGNTVFRINAGTFNNVLPRVNGQEIGTTNAYLAAPNQTSLVLLTAVAAPKPNPAWPVGFPFISLTTNQVVPPATPTAAYLSIGKIVVTNDQGNKVYTIQNFVSGSLWGERYECGDNLEYWFSRI